MGSEHVVNVVEQARHNRLMLRECIEDHKDALDEAEIMNAQTLIH